MANITQIVSLSEFAFFTIVTSALETYSVCHQDDPKADHLPVETYGNLWGYQVTTTRNESVFHVTLADVDVSAKRESGAVSPAAEAFNLKHDFTDSFFPELEYLGDFHSHPYDRSEARTELEVERNKLYLQSTDDQRFAKFHQENGRPYRLQIIATVFGRPEMVRRAAGHLADDLSCIRIQYDKRTVWIKAYAYRINDQNRTSRKVNKDNIALICPSAGVTVATINSYP